MKEQAPSFTLEILEGPIAGKVLAPKGSSFRVGRTKASKLQIKDPAVSERHAEIAFRDGRWCIKDLGSSNGTKVDDVEVTDEWMTLEHNSIIKIGSESLARIQIESMKENDENLTVQQFLEAECKVLEDRIRQHAESLAKNLKDSFAESKVALLEVL